MRLPDPQLSPASSTAVWAAIPPVGPANGVILQLYWTAFDPVRPRWRYTAQIDVRDQAGSRLRGRDGHSNPARLNGDIGGEVKHFDHRQEAIVFIP